MKAALSLAALTIVFIMLSARDARADGLNGIFTYQSGLYTAVDTGESNINTVALGIDDAGNLLITFGASGNSDLLSVASHTLTPIALQGAPVGSSTDTSRIFFTQLGGTTTPITLPTAFSFPTRLNDSGQITGATCCGPTNFLFNLSDNTGATIGAPGNILGINDQGQIVGVTGNNGSFISYIRNADGTLTFPLLPAGCYADAINDSGQIAGNCVNQNGSLITGFIDSAGTFTALEFPNNNINDTIVTGINDSGEVVGEYLNVPEPGTLALVSVGLAGLIFNKRNKVAVSEV
jgi:hypothetical protein